jgi:YbgC/YbaW family acyl-CoA thioester hydrolase
MDGGGDDSSKGSGFRHPVDVRFFEVDSLGVVFNMWYLGWCDEAMSAFMESIGYGYATLRAAGVDAVLRKAELEWLRSLEAFQHAEISVRVDQVGTTSFRLRYDIERVDGERLDDDDPVDGAGRMQGAGPGGAQGAGLGRAQCARVAITYVCVEIAGRNTTPIPPGMRKALTSGHA